MMIRMFSGTVGGSTTTTCRRQRHVLGFIFLLVLLGILPETVQCGHDVTTDKNILVVGSMNADTFLPVARLPVEGENLTLLPGKQPVVDLPGGKGCTQAVAAAKLVLGPTLGGSSSSNDNSSDDGNNEEAKTTSNSINTAVSFLGQFGNDPAATILRTAMERVGISLSHCQTHSNLPSGRGYVFLTESGSVSAVVSGGSNEHGWSRWKNTWEKLTNQEDKTKTESSTSDCVSNSDIDSILDGVNCILLQREIPEYVNLLLVKRAKELYGDKIIVIQDIGGEDRAITRELVQCCDYIIPNESELHRLSESSITTAAKATSAEQESKDNDNTDLVVEKAKLLQTQLGARNVLVTRGKGGSTLVTESGEIIHQSAYHLPESKVIDETGAGDCYRAAFAIALLEGYSLDRCMQFASAAGSCSVQVNGAVPSTPSRAEVEHRFAEETVLHIPRGDGQEEQDNNENRNNDKTKKGTFLFARGGGDDVDGKFPFLIGSRLNSMKDRPELWEASSSGSSGGSLTTPHDFVTRQATVRGLTCVDFNYPQHFVSSWADNTAEVKKALDDVGLVAGAVCLRYPSKYARGAMNHPNPTMRQEAIELTKKAAQTALELGSNEVVVWSAYDGYDYPFQVNYDEKWEELVLAFQEICDAYPSVKFSLEYKPTDENTRFFTVPTTAAALLLVDEINRPNMGLTLDVGHMLMAGENPGQSIAMVGSRKKLFGIQLNDGYTRLAAEDGMMFGSIHPSMALEIMYQLKRTEFNGHFYFDTFPQRTDPVKEAEYNIRQVKKYWYAATRIDESILKEVTSDHDAIGALEIVNEALRTL